ncbi:MAG: DUF2066 domain-containing protein [Woeseia sp.]
MKFTLQGVPRCAAKPDMKRQAAAIVLLHVLLLGFAMAVSAAETASLYTARVPVNANDPESRERAYAAALSQILRRMTGSQDILQAGQIEALFPNPARYVMQYRPGEESTLWVTLDGATLERTLRQAGHTVWGGERPLTLVWLAVDWGGGEREIIAADDDAEPPPGESGTADRDRLLRERIREAALDRGIPVAFPLMDATERQAVGFSDVWGGFTEQVLEASGRYGASSVMVGRIRPIVVERNRWTWFFGEQRRDWSGEPEEAVGLLADALASQFAISGSDPLQSIRLTVSGIDSISAYGAVHSFVQGLEIVDEVRVETVTGNTISYQVKAHGGRERLERTLSLSRMLEAVEARGRYDSFDRPLADGRPAADALEYQYRP